MSGTTGTIPLQTVVADQLITSALWNAEFQNISTLLDASGAGGHSDTDADAKIQTAPYPGSVLSNAVSIAGELERLRYQVAQILGTDYWYKPAATDLTSVGNVVVPVGAIVDFCVATAPSAQWHLADGTAISRAAYPTLFTLIGTTFGVGNGTTTFNLPDYRDRMSIGAGTSYAAAATGGATTGTASHSHTVNSHTHDLSNHTHLTDYDLLSNIGVIAGSTNVISVDSDGISLHGAASAAGGALRSILNRTKVPSTNTSGATAPGTDTQAPTVQVLNPYLGMYKLIRVL